MAREKKTQRNRSRTRVPVASRAADVRKAQHAQLKQKQKPDRMSIAGVGVIMAIVLVVLLVIAVPLRNYYHGRSEIARLNESIAAKQDEKAALLSRAEQAEATLTERTAELSGLKRHVSQMVSAIFGKFLISLHHLVPRNISIANSSLDFVMQVPGVPTSTRAC